MKIKRKGETCDYKHKFYCSSIILYAGKAYLIKAIFTYKDKKSRY